MAEELNARITRTAAVMDEAIESAIAGYPRYPRDAAFIDPEAPHAGREISRALDDGYAVVLVRADGREQIIPALTAAR